MLPVLRSTSAKTGVAPAWTIVFAVAQKVRGVVMTSSPGPPRLHSRDRLECGAELRLRREQPVEIRAAEGITHGSQREGQAGRTPPSLRRSFLVRPAGLVDHAVDQAVGKQRGVAPELA